MGVAEEHWEEFDAWSLDVLAGGDPLELPMDRFLNLVYRFATEGAEQQDKDRFDVRLNTPTMRGRAQGRPLRDDSPWSKENEESALSGLVGALTGRA